MVTSTQTALASEARKQRSRLAYAKRQTSRALLKSDPEAQVTTNAAAALSERAQKLGNTGVASASATPASLEIRVAINIWGGAPRNLRRSKENTQQKKKDAHTQLLMPSEPFDASPRRVKPMLAEYVISQFGNF